MKPDMVLYDENVFFTADPHFGHANIMKFAKRLEFMTPEEREIMESGDTLRIDNLKISDKSVRNMTDELIDRWNNKVQSDSTVFMLGDFMWHSATSGPPQFRSIMNRLRGNIYLIWGNHDPRFIRAGFKDAFDVLFLEVAKTSIWLSHYAHRSWPHKHHGAWHLYGHDHTGLPQLRNFSMDVGVDNKCAGYAPMSFADVKRYLAFVSDPARGWPKDMDAVAFEKRT